nr:immunoglobulin heavy chain junction region [Mus musculus]
CARDYDYDVLSWFAYW